MSGNITILFANSSQWPRDPKVWLLLPGSVMVLPTQFWLLILATSAPAHTALRIGHPWSSCFAYSQHAPCTLLHLVPTTGHPFL